MIEDDISDLQEVQSKLLDFVRTICDKVGIVCPYEDHNYTRRWDRETKKHKLVCTWCQHQRELG